MSDPNTMSAGSDDPSILLMVKEHKRSHLTTRALAQHAQRLADEHPDPESILQKKDVNDSMTRRERESGR